MAQGSTCGRPSLATVRPTKIIMGRNERIQRPPHVIQLLHLARSSQLFDLGSHGPRTNWNVFSRLHEREREKHRCS